MLWFGVAPLFTLLAPFYFVLWTPFVAIAHLLFSVTCSVLLIEALMLDFWKIPFTCSYPAGKANVTVLWIFYWIAFTSYAYSMAALEAWMLVKPWRLLIFYAAAALLWYLLQRHFRRSERVFTLIFDDLAEPIVRTLGLSELGWITQTDTRPVNPGRLLPGARRSSVSHISRVE
jgi:hypothetical protein